MELDIQTALKFPVAQIHEAFLQAFSQYPIPIKETLAEFESRLLQVNFAPNLSAIITHNGQIVAFWLSGNDLFEGKNVAYNCGTGVVEAYRSMGLVNEMALFLNEIFKKNGIEQLLLEVLEDNFRAIRAYRSAGFLIAQKLHTYTLEPQDIPPKKQDNFYGKFIPQEAIAPQWLNAAVFRPSFQHAQNAFKRLKKPLLVFFDKQNQPSVALAFHNNKLFFAWQNQKISLADWGEIWHKSFELLEVQRITCLNISTKDTTFVKSILQIGAKYKLCQYEMKSNLHKP